MILRDISFPTPEENILFDDVLLYLAERGDSPEVLRFWESGQPFIVLGRVCKEKDDVNIEAAIRDGIPLLRRSSGGGTVVQGRGCLNYSLILDKKKDPHLADLRQSYRVILSKVIDMLQLLGVDAVFQPISDLAIKNNQKKFSGNAQKRGRQFILHHGTLLYDFDLALIEKYLKIPRDIPEYRRGRTHLEFVANIPLSIKEIKKGFRKLFPVSQEENSLNQLERNCLKNLLESRNVIIDLANESSHEMRTNL